MNKKLILSENIKNILIIFFMTIGITIILLGLVTFFERMDIHVAGSRDMWIGLIGTLLGGAYTLLGVQLTLTHQKKDYRERQRLENLPILKITSHSETLVNYSANSIFTFCNNEIYTSGFPKNPYIPYPIINISLANNNPAFDVYIESCFFTNYSEDATKHSAYAPVKHRLVADETLSSMFWIEDFSKHTTLNALGILRINYSDLFGNQYFQDVLISYRTNLSEDAYTIEITEAKPPILASSAPLLSEMSKAEYNYMYENK